MNFKELRVDSVSIKWGAVDVKARDVIKWGNEDCFCAGESGRQIRDDAT